MSKREQVLAITVGISLISNDKDEDFKRDILNKPIENLIKRFEISPAMCAEAETLSIYLQRNAKLNTRYSVYLLYVDDPENPDKSKNARAVAEKLKELFAYFGKTRDEFKRVKVEGVRGFRLSVFSRGEEPASNDFFSVLLALREQARKGSRGFGIIAPGGYKIITVYAAIFGFLFKVPVYYKFKESEELISLDDPLPLYWDIRELEHHITHLRSKAALDTLHRFLGDHIEDIRREAFYSEPLLDSAMPEGELKSLLKEKLPFWMNQWIGDQVPEMVEHSKKHSRRLLEKFEFLNEQGVYTKEFCEDEEIFYFLLIASAYLHDIGHTMIEYNGLQLQAFPEILRRYHHLISKKLLEIETYRNKLGLNDLDDDIYKALKLICMYHRKSMYLAAEPLGIKEMDKVFFEYFGEEAAPMIEHKEFKKLSENKQRITLKVAALLKLLDEMDVQADRIVDEYYDEAREFRTELEVKHLKKQLESLKDKYSEKNISGDMESILKRFALEELKDLSNPVILAHSLANKIAFKREQKNHFHKHSSIIAVVPKIGKDGVITINITTKSRDDGNEVKRDLEEQKQLLVEDGENLPFRLFPFPLEKMRIKVST